MALIATAESAQDIAAALSKFLDPVSESSTDITSAISECFAISSALRELDEVGGDSRQNRSYDLISDDVRAVLLSLRYTFEDVNDLFGGLLRTIHLSQSAVYRQVWRDIENFFLDESRNTLSVRLEYYKRYLQDMICIMIDGSLPNYEFDELAYRIDQLLKVQEDRLDGRFSNLAIGVPGAGTGAGRQRSFERRRPQALEPETLFSGRGAERRRQRPAPPRRDDLARREDVPRREDFVRREDAPRRDREDRYRAPARRLPFTPNRFDELDYFGRGDEIDEYPRAPEPPGSPTMTTTFSQSSSTSSSIQHWVPKVFEQSQSNTPFKTVGPASACYGEDIPHASSRLAGDHEKVLQQSFENGGLIVRLYRCFEFEVPSGQSKRATISDDHYEHTLRVYRDRDSGAIRLQASVKDGELKRKPVWTAFITHNVCSNRWIRYFDSKTIHLADLQRYVFCSDYEPLLGPGGEHELVFKKTEDRRDFEGVIEDLAEDLAHA
ncbi:hypothetical protein MMC29_002207 [Sticta canariensis]|nr:hypothetical protein [Sticta canariensis]